MDNLAGSSLDRDDAFTAADWRDAEQPKPVPATLIERRRVPRAPDPLHRRARTGTRTEERARARELVGAAKAVVSSTFDDIRSGRRINVASLEPVVAGVAASVARDPAALPSVTRLKTAHEYTYLHSVAVCGLMIALADELRLDAALVHDIGLAGLLHDVGKARVPVELLDKPGPLDFDEYALVQQHTSRGHELLQDAGITSAIALDVCLHHHERVDGGGYPSGRSGADLSVFARMGAVCDVYDAVTSTRSYKPSWSPGSALDWMADTSGQFDPRLLQAFRRTIGAFPLGSLVRLESQRLAIVVAENEDDPSCPDVCVFFCAASRRSLVPVRTRTRHDPVLAVELPGRWNFDDWENSRAQMLAKFGGA